MTPLKRARVLCGKRQIDVFNEVGIWPGRLSMLENGLLTPREYEIQTLAKVYGTLPGQLRDGNQLKGDTLECRAG